MLINIEAEKRAYRKFIAAGMTPAGACGLTGNLEAESDGFYTNRVEYLCLKRLKESGQVYTDETYTAAVDAGKISYEEFLHPFPSKQYGFGLAQWTSPGRKAGLWNLAHTKGVSIADEDMQIEFLLWELENNYQGVLKVLKSTTSIREASDIVLIKFEVPANTGETVCASRAARGQKFYDNYVKKEEKDMGVRMANCGQDENSGYYGGKAGDQTGKEWYLRNWYSYPWNYILRWKDEELANLFADLAVEAAQNNLIGYDQWQRDTFWQHLKASGYRPSKITVACEADCSSGTIALIRAVGYLKGIKELQECDATYTGNMMTYFRSVNGKKYFDILTGKYLTDPSLAKRGDINLNVQNHVNITVDNGANSGKGNVAGTRGYLSKGDNGSAVKEMQKMLIKVGYSCGTAGADGDFGDGTETALKKFQADTGLAVDGQYGSESKAKLEAMYKEKTASSNSAQKAVEAAQKFDVSLAGKYKTTADLWMKTGAGKEKDGILVVPKGKTVESCGHYNVAANGSKWLHVVYAGKAGYCSEKYLKKQ